MATPKLPNRVFRIQGFMVWSFQGRWNNGLDGAAPPWERGLDAVSVYFVLFQMRRREHGPLPHISRLQLSEAPPKAYTPAVEPKIKSLGLRQLTALIGVGNYRVFDPPVRGRGTNHSFTVKYPRQITMMAFAPDM
jgi:hypothetical protein